MVPIINSNIDIIMLLHVCMFVSEARLRKPHDGLFSGIIDALDTVTNTYRITFDRVGFGTYSVPDIDVVVCIVAICLCMSYVSVRKLVHVITIL